MNPNLYRDILENMYEGVYFVDRNRVITFWNKGAERISGFTADEVLGKHCYDNILNHVDEEGNQLCLHSCPLNKTIAQSNQEEAIVYLHHKNGHRVQVMVKTIPIKENGEVVGAIEFFVDESEKTAIVNRLEKYKTIALIDQLTNLPNRRYLNTYLASKIKDFYNLKMSFAVAFIDIDHFKYFNDTYGHNAGDTVLKVIAKSLQTALRSTDIVARWGGEEFIAVLAGVDQKTLNYVTEKIRVLIENSFINFNEQRLNVTVSIGASVFKDNDCMESIITRTDQLMYQSKINGRNTVTTD